MAPGAPLVLLGGLALPGWLSLTWEIIRTSLGTVLLWGVWSWVLGLGAAFGLFFILRAVKGYRWGWPHAKWLRLATLILMVTLLPPLFCAVGVLQCVYSCADRALTKSRTVNSVYSAVGGVGADVIGAVYLIAPQIAGAAGSLDVGAVSLRELDGFRRGEWEINVPELSDRLANTDDRTLSAIAARVSAEARSRVPLLESGPGKWILDASLDRIVLPLLNDAVGRKSGGLSAAGARIARAALPGLGPSGGGRGFLEGLEKAARGDGAPETIGRRDLSVYLVQHWVVGPVLLSPFRGVIRAKQVLALALIGSAVVLPVLSFRLAHLIWPYTKREA